MRPLVSRRAVSRLAVALALCAAASPLAAQAPAVRAGNPRKTDPELAAVRAATERFRDVRVAVKEGYLRDPMNLCDDAAMMGRPASYGAMGIHYFRPDLLGITGPPNPRVDGTGTHTDFTKPAILIYEPQRDGSLRLVAVENLVFIKAWEKAGNSAPPSFMGVPWDRMEDDPRTPVDEAHMFEPHYDRHVWLYRDNPRGIFAQFNPNVSCRAHTGGAAHAHAATR